MWVVLEGRQTQFASDSYDVCLVRAPRLETASDKLCTPETLSARGQSVRVDEFNLSIIRLNLSDELSELTFNPRMTCFQLGLEQIAFSGLWLVHRRLRHTRS
jgi:hypothetical protein